MIMFSLFRAAQVFYVYRTLYIVTMSPGRYKAKLFLWGLAHGVWEISKVCLTRFLCFLPIWEYYNIFSECLASTVFSLCHLLTHLTIPISLCKMYLYVAHIDCVVVVFWMQRQANRHSFQIQFNHKVEFSPRIVHVFRFNGVWWQGDGSSGQFTKTMLRILRFFVL